MLSKVLKDEVNFGIHSSNNLVVNKMKGVEQLVKYESQNIKIHKY